MLDWFQGFNVRGDTDDLILKAAEELWWSHVNTHMDSIHRFCYSDVQFIGSLRVIHVSITFFAVYKRMTYVNMLCQGYVLLLIMITLVLSMYSIASKSCQH